MSKFNVGDIVIGNSKNTYGISCEGWQGEVTYVAKGSIIMVKNLPDFDQGTFEVNDRYFDLISRDNCISIW